MHSKTVTSSQPERGAASQIIK